MINKGSVITIETENGYAELQVTSMVGKRIYFEVEEQDGLDYTDVEYIKKQMMEYEKFKISKS